MSKATDRVVAGFIQLSSSDRQDAIKEINNYMSSDSTKRELMAENFSKRAGVDLGPMDSGQCPCCGK